MDKPKLPAPLKVEGATSRQYVDHLNVMVIYLRELEKWHEWLISATEYRCRELKKENTALEARCRDLLTAIDCFCQHSPSCAKELTEGEQECNCGLDALLATTSLETSAEQT